MSINRDDAKGLLARISDLFEFEDPYEALELCERALDFYDTVPDGGDLQVDFERARLTMYMGVATRRTGDFNLSIEILDRALKLMDQEPLRSRMNLDFDRALICAHRGSALRQNRRIPEAMAEFAYAEEAFSRLAITEDEEADIEAARVLVERGLSLQTLGQGHAAVSCYDRALEILREHKTNGRTDLDFDFARAFRFRALVWRSLKRFGDANDDLELARALIPLQTPFTSQKWYLFAAQCSVSHALVDWDFGRLESGLDRMATAERWYLAEPLKSRKDLNRDKSELYMDWAVVLRRARKTEEALASVNKAVDLAQEEVLNGRRELDLMLARLLMNRGVYRRILGDVNGALNDHCASRRILFAPPLADHRHLDGTRARLLMQLARSLKENGQPEAAADMYDESISIYFGVKLKSQPEMDTARALTLMYRSNCIYDLRMMRKALDGYELAQGLFEGPTIGPWLPRNSDRARLYASMARVMQEMRVPHTWARDKSGRMSEMLELAPREEKGLWSAMRLNYRLFHERWLSFAISRGEVEPIPEILAALQGRDIAASALDRLALEAAEAAGTPEAVLAYQVTRIRLRELADRMMGSEGTGDIDDGPLDGRLRSARRRTVSDAAPFPRGAHKASEAELLTEYLALHEKLPGLRVAAAAEAGYEMLLAPHRQVTSEWLRGSLARDEAAILLFEHADVAQAVLLRGDGGSALIELPALLAGADEMRRFCVSLDGRGGVRRGGWECMPSGGGKISEGIDEDVAFDGSEEAHGTEETAPETAGAAELMDNADLAAFWNRLETQQREALWGPLAEALSGMRKVVWITHGRLQLTALGAGAPDIELVQYPGLAFYALRRGLYGSLTVVPEAARPRVAVISDEAASDIPLAALEGTAAAQSWRAARAEVIHPGPYPSEGSVRLLHVASHGELRDGVPVMLLGDDEVAETDVLKGAVAEAALINICLGGQTLDDPLDGNPSGLVSGLLRRGAQVVVASLPPLPDIHGCMFGLLVTLAMTENGAGLAEATDRARRVIAGEADPGGLADRLAGLLGPSLAEAAASEVFACLRPGSPEATKNILTRHALEANLWWLDKALIERIAMEMPADETALKALLGREIRPVPSPEFDPAATGVIRYGLTVFGEAAAVSG